MKQARIVILGSCSGTEPISDRHHTAWILQAGERLYQFDAGENCSHRAHTMGMDLLSLRAMFISHGHSDHLAGFTAELCVINKVRNKYRRVPAALPLPIYAAVPEQLAAVPAFLQEPGIDELFEPRRIAADGPIFDDGTIRVEARHNAHLGIPADGVWKSYSFRITIGERRIVYSGDVKKISELDEWLGGCDLLMMESGHHHPWEAAAYLRANAAIRVKRLFFLHHGRDYLDHPEETASRTAEAWGTPVEFAVDGTTLELPLR